ncbi:PilZ domain-containing protein [Desulfovibrio inopinatus]|uniref:PilZ domain-containing protein n=1 Tax=Desulfovibrio inopinatus TaxID=102109 RepID=UPI000427D07E|nr:PilZ domain-containing protein [Desulfovibrio inopinatus]
MDLVTQQESSTVLVLTQSPDVYTERLAEVGLEPHFAGDLPELLEALGSGVLCNGLILDVQRVMQADRMSRDMLFSYADSVPIVRSKVERGTGHVVFIDSLDTLDRECHTTGYRSMVRVPVKFNALLSAENDPVMAQVKHVNILDVSIGGCFIYSMDNFDDVDFIHIKIMEIENKLPILCNIRWRQEWGRDNVLPGVGVKFVSIKVDQLDEIKEKYITPYESDFV